MKNKVLISTLIGLSIGDMVLCNLDTFIPMFCQEHDWQGGEVSNI